MSNSKRAQQKRSQRAHMSKQQRRNITRSKMGQINALDAQRKREINEKALREKFPELFAANPEFINKVLDGEHGEGK